MGNLANGAGAPGGSEAAGDETSQGDIKAERETSPSTDISTKTLADLRAEALDGELVGARRLTFREQCGAFAALYAGVRNMVVARAFGVSLQCASAISGCLEFDPDPYRDVEGSEKIMMDHNRNRNPNRHRRYETVGREFEALGKDEFNRRYYTERIVKRILVAKAELNAERWAKKKRK